MSAGVSDGWNDSADLGGMKTHSRKSREWRQVRLPLVSWKLVVLLASLAVATACFAGECPCSRTILPRTTLTGLAGIVGSVIFGPGGSMLTSVGRDGSILLWNLETQQGKPWSPVGAGQDRCVSFSPDGNFLAAGRPTAAVTLHDLKTDETRSLDDRFVGTAGAKCLAFSADGASLAVGQPNGQITFWDVATRRPLSEMSAHRGYVTSLAYSPDGTTLASSGGDRTVRLWDLATGAAASRFPASRPHWWRLRSRPTVVVALADQRSPFVQLVDSATGSPRAATSRIGRHGRQRCNQPRRHDPRRGRSPRCDHVLGSRHTPHSRAANHPQVGLLACVRTRWTHPGLRRRRWHHPPLGLATEIDQPRLRAIARSSALCR